MITNIEFKYNKMAQYIYFISKLSSIFLVFHF